MTKKTPQQTERLSKSANVLKTNKGQLSIAKENIKEIQTTAKELKQVYQTYIYRSFGGGYQGL